MVHVGSLGSSSVARWLGVFAMCALYAPERQRGAHVPMAIAGCEQLRASGACELAPEVKVLYVWRAGTSGSPVEQWTGSYWRQIRAAPVAGGLRALAEPELASGELQLRFADGVELRLPLQRAPRWPWVSALEGSDNAAALEHLRSQLTAAKAGERAALLFELARREYRLGERSAGARHLQAAGELALAHGSWSLARRAYALWANHATNAHAFGEARRAIAQASAVPEPEHLIDGQGRALVHNSRGLYAAEIADLPAATLAYDEAERWAQRGALDLAGHVQNGRAFVSLQAGRLREAAALYGAQVQSEQASRDACYRGIALANLGWVELELMRADPEVQGTNPTEHLKPAVELLAGCRAAPAWRLAHAKLSLAFDALRRREFSEAEGWLAGANALAGEPRLEAWRQLLGAELELAAGRPERALPRFDGLATQARASLTDELAWRGLEGSGRTLLALSRSREALGRFEQAERVLAHALERLPVQRAHLPFLFVHYGSASGMVEAQLAAARPDLAFEAARRGRRRWLLSLLRVQAPRDGAQQEAWSEWLEAREQLQRELQKQAWLPQDEVEQHVPGLAEQRAQAEAALEKALALLGGPANEFEAPLREPAPGELLLMWLPSEAGSEWHGFAQLDGSVFHDRRAGEPHSADLLAPFADAIFRATHITVLAEGAFARVDVHALPFRGAALLEHATVAYSLDLPPDPQPSAAGPLRALVAGDAGSELPHARHEIAEVANELGAHGWQVRVLAGAELRLGTWREATQGVQLFHYAGHARANAREAWQGQLPLAGGPLSMADILELPRAPRAVVLSACEAAQASDVLRGAGLSLAHAFIVAGSGAVVAPTRPVQDQRARQLARMLTAALARGTDLPDAYRAIALEPGADSYRLLIR